MLTPVMFKLSRRGQWKPRDGIWKTVLGNILQNHRWKRGVPKRDLRVLLQYVEEDMGGEIAESTQEGEEVACTLVKEAVLRQILQHTLTLHTKDGDDQVLLLAEEQLETLQALLDEGELREDKPALPRSQIPNASNQAEKHSKVGEEAAGTGLGNNDTLVAHRTANQDDPPGALGEDDARHVVHFIHGPGEGLRIASSVLCATIGVIETEGGRTAETFLIRTIAGEIHNIARHILYRSQLEEEGEQLQRGTKRLSAAEVIQWSHRR